jgi:sulfite reductase (NADPH) hemoprotein beta-component
LYRRDIDHGQIVAALEPLFADYARDRLPDERFGDFVIRAGHVRATTSGSTFHADIGHVDFGASVTAA